MADTLAFDPCARGRCRQRHVEAMGGDVWVPRHIVRLDSASLAGWQVRFERPFVYLSDAAYGSPERSFRAAKRHLRQAWRAIPKRTSRNGAAGVRVIRTTRGHWYAEATHPRRQAPRRFYIGTDATVTTSRSRAAQQRAREQRHAWLAAMEAPLR